MKHTKLLFLPLLALTLGMVGCSNIDRVTVYPDNTNNTNNGNTRVPPTGLFSVNFEDEHNLIKNKKQLQSAYAPGNEIKIYTGVVMDADVAMYVNGAFYSTGKSVEVNNQYMLEFSYTMVPNAVTITIDIANINTYSTTIVPDYGIHIKGEVTLLLGTALMPFNPLDYGYDKVAAGDYVTVKYVGDWYEEESYPSRACISRENILSVNIRHGTIFEFVVDNGVATSVDGASFTTQENVINRNGSFSKVSSLPNGTIIYGINPVTFDSFNSVYLYSYNPLV